MLKTTTPRGFSVPPNQPSTLVDRDAPDLELEIINKLLPLLADRAFNLFDLADIAGLPFAQLADLLESERVDKAYRAMVRILAIRQKFLDAQSHFVTTSQLLSIASAQPLDAKEADQSRKAANKLHALHGSSPVAERGGRGRWQAQPDGGGPDLRPNPSPWSGGRPALRKHQPRAQARVTGGPAPSPAGGPGGRGLG